MKLRVAIACGGTGGHLFPGIAVAQELRSRGHDALLLISEKEVDAIAAADHPELRFEKIPAIGMPRLASPKIIPFGLKFWRTLRATRNLLRSFGPHAVLGMGGFTSFAPVLAGRRLGARTFVHESNAIPGKANRLTARFCDVVLLGIAECARSLPGRNCRVVGTPLRASMLAAVDVGQAWQFFGLAAGRKTVLVMGGSQGARGVNRALVASLPRFDAMTTQFIWLTGRDDESDVRAAVAKTGMPAFIAAFHGRLDLAYRIADLCIARSGGGSLAELAHFGVATVLIPLPTAAEDHQTRNAEVFASTGAAILLPQPEATGEKLGVLMRDLLDDDPKRHALASRLKARAIPDAASRVVEAIEQSVSTNGG